jgi:NADH:ubiquinone oxidoreductase subunit 2 (subunit N)
MNSFLVIIYIAVVVVEIAAAWMLFAKAGQPGWAAIIPIYNVVVAMRVAQRPAWWTILMFIPFVSLVIGIIVALDIARLFGKSSAFAIGLIFLSFIFMPILGFGSARYQGGSISQSGPRIQPAV